MKRVVWLVGIVMLFSTASFSQFSFYLIDNFESGKFEQSKWWSFGTLEEKIVKNAPHEGRDLIAESCGEYSLGMSGKAKDWYVGGIGTDLSVDATQFSRFQLDIYGSFEAGGKLIIELFDDDNSNYTIEQDPQKNFEPVKDDKFVAEVNILGNGFTLVSIPFSAFHDVNPGVGNDKWDPNQENGSGGLLKLQLVAIAGKEDANVTFRIDNLLLTY